MALDINGRFDKDRVSRTITVLDLTYLYSITNPGGYGAPNLAIGDVTDAALIITLPDENTLLPGTEEVTFDGSTDPLFFPSFPNTNLTPFVVNGEMAGYGDGEKLPDGIYKIGYHVTDGTNTYSTTEYLLLDGEATCCLANLAEQVNVSKCSCKDANNFEEGWLMLDIANASMVCENINAAAAALLRAKELCGGCSDC